MSCLSISKTDRKNLLILLCLFAAVRFLFIWLMPYTFSRDMIGWLSVIDLLQQGSNPYSASELLNYPPLWIQVLYWVHIFSVKFHTDPVRMIQFILCSADAVSMTVCYFMLQRFFNAAKPFYLVFFAFVINPVLLLLSCQHCNMDQIAAMWTILFVYMLLVFYRTGQPSHWLMACLFLGMGILTKTIPVILSPLLLSGIRKTDPATRFIGAVLVFLPVSLGVGIIYVLAPDGVSNSVIHYRSLAGWYGLTGIFNYTGLYEVNEFYKKFSPLLFLAIMAFTARKVWQLRELTPAQLVISAAAILLFIPTLGPGYSPPYILWYFALLPVFWQVSGRNVRAFLLAGFIVTCADYIFEYATFWSHGAFLVQMFPTPSMQHFMEQVSYRNAQVAVRMPYFIVNLFLLYLLIKTLYKNRMPAAAR